MECLNEFQYIDHGIIVLKDPGIKTRMDFCFHQPFNKKKKKHKQQRIKAVGIYD